MVLWLRKSGISPLRTICYGPKFDIFLHPTFRCPFESLARHTFARGSVSKDFDGNGLSPLGVVGQESVSYQMKEHKKITLVTIVRFSYKSPIAEIYGTD
jgi:hypothetical protein